MGDDTFASNKPDAAAALSNTELADLHVQVGEVKGALIRLAPGVERLRGAVQRLRDTIDERLAGSTSTAAFTPLVNSIHRCDGEAHRLIDSLIEASNEPDRMHAELNALDAPAQHGTSTRRLIKRPT